MNFNPLKVLETRLRSENTVKLLFCEVGKDESSWKSIFNPNARILFDLVLKRFYVFCMTVWFKYKDAKT